MKAKQIENLKIIKSILTNKELVIQFLLSDSTNEIVDKIFNNQKLLEKLLNVPKTFWDEALENGIIIHSDFTYKTKTGTSEDIEVKHMYMEEKQKNIPAIAYQIKRNPYPIKIEDGLNRKFK